MRSVLSVLAGAVVWAVLWISTTQSMTAAMPEALRPGQPIDSILVLLVLLSVSVAYSVLAGYTTAVVARRAEVAHTVALGVLQLALGIVFQAQSWNIMPLWYHVLFLALLIPGNVAGGRLRVSRRAAMQPA